ncbi:MAG: hypothetical protein FGM48_05325 [Candidatus Nanopelagicaceae bacterium]|nr:hypothetical protein [Candidatus Nanopelagicaceae bacterium]
MKRSFLVFALVSSLLFGLFGAGSFAAVRAGAACTKAGATSITAGKKYTCIKSGKKLVWNKGVVVKKEQVVITELPKSEPSPSQTPVKSNEFDVKSLAEKLQAPTFMSSKTTGNIFEVQFKVEPEAIGGYIESKQLSLDFKKTKQDKNSDGVVTIRAEIPEDFVSQNVNVNLFAYSKNSKSSCCSGFTTMVNYSNPKIRPLMQDTMQTIKWAEPKEIASTNITEITSRANLSDLTQCKIKDAPAAGENISNPQRHFISGFGLYEERAPLTRSPIIQFVTIDFPDLQGKRSPKEDLKSVTDFLGKYWKAQTTNGTELDFRIPNSFIRMPKNVVDYELNVDFFSGKWKSTTSFDYVRAAIKEADPQIDFSQADVMVIAVPSEVTRQQIAAFVAESSEKARGQGFDTAEKRIYNTLIMAGPVSTPDFELLNWAHELGHNFGLTDIRNTLNVAAQDSSDLGIYDLMNSMLAPELLAWNRFIIGVLNDDQVRCVTSGSTTHLIKPVEMNTKENKLVVIPTGKYQAIAIESRRAIGFDATLGTLSEGVIVYTIDTTIPYNLSPMKLVPRVGSTDSVWRRDAALKVGDAVTTQGWRITVIESGDYGDVVKVEKI